EAAHGSTLFVCDPRFNACAESGVCVPYDAAMTPTREAACSCGQPHLTAEGDPIRVSMCHCLACQRQTGSAFGIQARFPADRVRITGRYAEYVRASDEGEERTHCFCPDCGAIVFWTPVPGS